MNLHKHDLSNAAATADAELILRTRSGDRGAFGELWRRHYPSGMSVARSITSSLDPDDLVQESYTRIYQAIIKGGGPNGSFRAYLFTSIRNTAAAWGRSRRETAIDELDSIADPDSTDEAADEALDRDLTAQAFRSLPARWQEVLWYSEIEQMRPIEIAPLLGMKAGAVSQLAFRAREGLREAWIQAHLRSAEADSECGWTIEHLGAHSRGNLRTRDQKRVDQHIDDCARCLVVAAEAKDVSGRLALVLLPLVLGVGGAGCYAATLQSTVSVVAAAPVPSGVFESSNVVAEVSLGTATLGIPSDGGSGGAVGGAGSTGTAGNGIAGGAITGIGALVGAGSAALVVAGVVAAATIVPGLANAPASTSLPSAGDVDNSSISSAVEPDPDANADDKFLLEIDTEESAPPADEDDAPEIKRSNRNDTPEPKHSPQVTPPASDEGGDADGTEPTVDPDESTTKPPVKPEVPPEPIDPEGPDGGTTDPDEPESPAAPTAPVTITGSSISIDNQLKTHLKLNIVGVPGTTVQALIDGSSDGADQIVLDADGNGLIDLRPTLWQIGTNASVTLQYLTDSGVEYPLQSTLARLGLTPTTANLNNESGAAAADEAPTSEVATDGATANAE